MNDEKTTKPAVKDWSILDAKGRVIGVASGTTAEAALRTFNRKNLDQFGVEAWRRGDA